MAIPSTYTPWEPGMNGIACADLVAGAAARKQLKSTGTWPAATKARRLNKRQGILKRRRTTVASTAPGRGIKASRSFEAPINSVYAHVTLEHRRNAHWKDASWRCGRPAARRWRD